MERQGSVTINQQPRTGTTIDAPVAESTVEPRRSLFPRWFPWLLAGYVLLDRGFAWLHIPGTPAFVSEIVLASSLGFALRGLVSTRLWSGSSSTPVLVAFMGWGLARSVPGLFSDTEVALRDGATWIYALFAFAVAAVVLREPAELALAMRGYHRLILPMVLWLPVISYLAESVESLTVPDSDVSLFSYKPGNASVHLVMAIAFLWLVWGPDRPNALRRRLVITALAVIGILAMATQGRGGFVAATMAGALLVLLVPERSSLMLAIAGSLVALAIAVVILDPTINVTGREVSAGQFADNVASIVSGEGEGELGGNVEWRLEHWERVWKGVNDDVPLIGHGFGPNLAEMYRIPQSDIGLRNAHNSHLTILARMGWVGAGLWLLLWAFWFGELEATRRRFRARGLRALSGLAAWAMVAVLAIMVNAVFDPTLEGPQVAIWLWAIFGLGSALAVLGRRSRSTVTAPGRDPALRVESALGNALSVR